MKKIKKICYYLIIISVQYGNYVLSMNQPKIPIAVYPKQIHRRDKKTLDNFTVLAEYPLEKHRINKMNAYSWNLLIQEHEDGKRDLVKEERDLYRTSQRCKNLPQELPWTYFKDKQYGDTLEYTTSEGYKIYFTIVDNDYESFASIKNWCEQYIHDLKKELHQKERKNNAQKLKTQEKKNKPGSKRRKSGKQKKRKAKNTKQEKYTEWPIDDQYQYDISLDNDYCYNQDDNYNYNSSGDESTIF